MTHTPGPWEVGYDPEDYEDCQSVWYFTQPPNEGAGAEIAGRICEPANAHLIAASPDLLEALILLVEECDETLAIEPDDLNSEMRARAEIAHAAIAKATGAKS